MEELKPSRSGDMSLKESKKLAVQYLKDQAEIIKKHGGQPRTSGDYYHTVVGHTTKTFHTLISLAKGK